MTEREWWDADHTTDPVRLEEIRLATTKRKRQLTSLAWCRILERQLPDWLCARYIDLLERFIEGEAGADEFPPRINSAELEIGPAAQEPYNKRQDWADGLLEAAILGDLTMAGTFTFLAMEANTTPRPVHALHDIFGPLLFRDIAVDPSWLTSDVLVLARGIYNEKAFDRMPILADALQDAGCDNDDILNHCRAENWEHVRGCWVIDLLLGRPWKEAG